MKCPAIYAVRGWAVFSLGSCTGSKNTSAPMRGEHERGVWGAMTHRVSSYTSQHCWVKLQRTEWLSNNLPWNHSQPILNPIHRVNVLGSTCVPEHTSTQHAILRSLNKIYDCQGIMFTTFIIVIFWWNHPHISPRAGKEQRSISRFSFFPLSRKNADIVHFGTQASSTHTFVVSITGQNQTSFTQHVLFKQ